MNDNTAAYDEFLRERNGHKRPKWNCDICDVSLLDGDQYQQHLRGKNHEKKMRVRAGNTKVWKKLLVPLSFVTKSPAIAQLMSHDVICCLLKRHYHYSSHFHLLVMSRCLTISAICAASSPVTTEPSTTRTSKVKST